MNTIRTRSTQVTSRSHPKRATPEARSIRPAPKAPLALPTREVLARLAKPSVPAWILLPLRLFLGVTFVYAGAQKLTDPQYFQPGAPGYIGRQIAAFSASSPLHGFLTSAALPHATLFGALVAWGELAIGLGTLAGLSLRPAAFFGLLINAIFFLSATWRVHPYFYGSDIVFAFGWLTLLLAGAEGAGDLALDCQVVPKLLARFAREERLAAGGRAVALLLGLAPARLASTASTDSVVYDRRGTAETRSVRPARQVGAMSAGSPDARVRAGGRHSRYTVRRSTSRREFLWGLTSGVVGMILVGLFGRVLGGGEVSTGSNGEPTGDTGTATATSAGSAAAATATAGTATSGVIGRSSAVPRNSATSFTIPTTGDPGVLVRLGNGSFVAYDATCTHAGCPVQYDPGSGLLICPCHGAEFDPAHAGAVIQGPAGYPLLGVPITTDAQSGDITLAQ